MPSINDWAAKAARRIDDVYPLARRADRPSVDRIAAIIATFAEPLLVLLREARREHYHCADSWYCCGKCTCGCERVHEHGNSCYPESHGGESSRQEGVCNCGADAFNAQLAAALSGKP